MHRYRTIVPCKNKMHLKHQNVYTYTQFIQHWITHTQIQTFISPIALFTYTHVRTINRKKTDTNAPPRNWLQLYICINKKKCSSMSVALGNSYPLLFHNVGLECKNVYWNVVVGFVLMQPLFKCWFTLSFRLWVLLVFVQLFLFHGRSFFIFCFRFCFNSFTLCGCTHRWAFKLKKKTK